MLFGRNKRPTKAYDGPPLDPKWARNRRGKYPRLLHLNTVGEGLTGLSAIFVIWHSGVRPGWVYVGKTDDLALTLTQALENEDIMEYEKNGGLYVTWSPVTEKRQNGVLRFLHETLAPKVPNPQAENIQDGPIKVLLPSRRGRGLGLRS